MVTTNNHNNWKSIAQQLGRLSASKAAKSHILFFRCRYWSIDKCRNVKVRFRIISPYSSSTTVGFNGAYGLVCQRDRPKPIPISLSYCFAHKFGQHHLLLDRIVYMTCPPSLSFFLSFFHSFTIIHAYNIKWRSHSKVRSLTNDLLTFYIVYFLLFLLG